jgi:Tol biopolymer transport system component
MGAEAAGAPRTARARARPLAIAFLVLLVACGAAAPRAGPLAGNGLIAFVPPDPRDIGISLLDPGRGEVRTLTADVRDVTSLAWSPDGTRIAFVLGQDLGIGIVDANTAQSRILTKGWFPPETGFSRPAWSPDAARIAFAAGGVPSGIACEGLECLAFVQAHIYVMDVDGGNPIRLTGDDVLSADPAWSPDGKRIAFVAVPPPEPGSPEPQGRPQIYVMDADGGSVRRLTSFHLGPRDLAWSPDGASLAFGTVSSDIFVMDATGASPRQIVASLVAPDGSFENGEPAWSPDGRRLLFTRSAEDGNAVWVVDADGTGQRKLINGCCASWQPVSDQQWLEG